MKKDDVSGYFTWMTSLLWADLTRIDQCVSKLLANEFANNVEELYAIQAAVRACADSKGETAGRLLNFGNALLALLRLPKLGRQMEPPSGLAPVAVSSIVLERRQQGEAKNIDGKILQAQVDGLPKQVDDRYVEVLMEYLTGVWLGLYFLGMPMAQLWDGVRRLAEQVGGVPSGPCTYKYIGDIYRTARQQVIRERGEWVERGQPATTAEFMKVQPVLVLTYRPLALLEDDIARAPVRNLTPATLQSLGQRYAVLQMRLYTQQSFPINYFVPKRALGRSIAYMLWEKYRDKRKVLDELANTAINIHYAIKKNFRVAAESCQSVWLMESAYTASFPTCVLGNKTGVYSLDGSQTLLHFSGNQVRHELLHSYRRKLWELYDLAKSSSTSMLEWDEDAILKAIETEVELALTDPTFPTV
jgi:hypothetical protein